MQNIEPIVSIILLIAYIFIATKQGKYITILKETNEQMKGITKAQSGLINDFEAYRKLFNIEDIKQMVQLKLDNQQLTLSKEYAEKEKAVVQEYLDTSSEHVKTITELSEKVKYYESSSTAVSKKLKEIEEQQKRDAYFMSKEFEDERKRFMEKNPLTAEKIREFNKTSKD